MAQEERPARVPASSKANSTEKPSNKRSLLTGHPHETRETLTALPAQAAEELPPILTRSEAEPPRKDRSFPAASSGRTGPTPSVEDEPMVSHLQVDAVTGTVAEKKAKRLKWKSQSNSVSVPPMQRQQL